MKSLLDQAKLRVLREINSRKVLPDWSNILGSPDSQWLKAVEAAKEGSRVLIATSTGGHQAVTPIDSMLAVALTLRGANVHFLLCDRFLPACMQAMSTEFDTATFLRQGPQSLLCDSCFRAGHNSYKPLQLPIHRLGEYVSNEEQVTAAQLAESLPQTEIVGYRLHDLAVGEHANAGALRYFAKGNLDDEPYGEAVLRRYLYAALLTTYAMERLSSQYNFEVACFHHGLYVPQGMIGEVCRQRQIRVVNWLPSYRKRTFIFTHEDTYHHTLMSEPISTWEAMPWTPDLEADILGYLKSRWQGAQDWIYFHNNPQEDIAKISQELGIDFSKPTIGMLTNVMWDAQLHYPANAFPNMRDWILKTIDYFVKRPDLQLLIRVHPAEIRGNLPSRQKVVDEVRKVYPNLPQNIYIIPPESDLSSYVAMLQCDSVIIYGTKMGIELTSLGVPVIVAGEAWIRNKGVTIDASSIEEYFQILDRLPLQRRMDEAAIQRARMYAYHFFFRRMIPLSFVEPAKSGWWPYKLQITQIGDLAPGRNLALDIICEGILHQTPFVYPAEQLAESSRSQKAPHVVNSMSQA